MHPYTGVKQIENDKQFERWSATSNIYNDMERFAHNKQKEKIFQVKGKICRYVSHTYVRLMHQCIIDMFYAVLYVCKFPLCKFGCLCVGLCVCMRVCICAFVCVCVRACLWVCVCMCACSLVTAPINAKFYFRVA